MDEFFEALTLMQTKKIKPFPIILYGKKYWSGLIDWMEKELLHNGLISRGDEKLFHLVGTPEEAVRVILRHKNK
jgi:predicted Rossmann-fold nucleotide-binding protein